MPIPGGLTTITVTSSYPAIDGSPLSGNVVFETDQQIMDSAGLVKFSGSATRVVFRGVMQPITLPCADNGALNPTGFSYKVTETLNGVTQTPYWVSLPSTLGATVDLSALTPAASPPSVSAFASNNTWLGANTFLGETIVPTPVNASDAATKAYADSLGGFGWLPTDYGLQQWTFDPAIAVTAAAPVSGTIYMSGLQIRRNVTVSNIYTVTGSTTAAGVTAAQNFAGLYSPTGTRLAQVSIDSAYGATSTLQTLNIGSQSLTPGLYWVGWIMNATTMPILLRATNVNTASINLNQSNATARYATAGTAQTALPASITPSSLSRVTSPFWFAIG